MRNILEDPLRRLPLLVALLSMTTAATLRGSEPARSDVSLQRPGYGAIALQAPSQPPSDQPSPGLSLHPRERAGDIEGSPVTKERSSAMPLVTIGSSLAVVLGLFAALVWVSKKTGRTGGGGAIPEEALRLLGQKSLGASGSIALVRCGRSVLVVGISAAGMHPLAQIDDDEEVRHLEATCLGESAASFQATLGEMQLEPATRGFIADENANPHARKKLFADRSIAGH